MTAVKMTAAGACILALASCAQPTSGAAESKQSAGDAAEVQTFSNIAVTSVSYLPFNISSFHIVDDHGNAAAGGSALPAGGSGSSCCYRLKGTRLHVTWKYYDGDEWKAGKKEIYTASANVDVVPTPSSNIGVASLMAVHFFPDNHVEIEFPATNVRQSRIPVLEVSRSLIFRFPELSEKYGHYIVVGRAAIRAVNIAWSRFGLRDEIDLERFAYLYLTLGRFFMDHPKVAAQLRPAAKLPGSFAAYSESLSEADIKAIKAFSKRKRLKSPIPLTEGEASL